MQIDTPSQLQQLPDDLASDTVLELSDINITAVTRYLAGRRLSGVGRWQQQRYHRSHLRGAY